MGDIQKKSDLINYILSKFPFMPYLEIGVDKGYNFREINTTCKESIDPESRYKATFPVTSDFFFKYEIPIRHYDIVLIDGLHLEEYVLRDITNTILYINPMYIIVHDCNPECEERQIRPRPIDCDFWNGDVWKAWVVARKIRKANMFVVDIDHGCGIITRGVQNPFYIPYHELTWENFVKNKIEWLNLKDVDYFKRFAENYSYGIY